jgi:hypothetical protein
MTEKGKVASKERCVEYSKTKKIEVLLMGREVNIELIQPAKSGYIDGSVELARKPHFPFEEWVRPSYVLRQLERDLRILKSASLIGVARIVWRSVGRRCVSFHGDQIR